MASEITVKNTLGFQFPGNAAQPTLADMGRFIKTLNGDRTKMDTAYKISDEKSVFIRFKCEDAMRFTLENNDAILPFRYTDGGECKVKMSVAGGNTRYVRVFDLPPEVTDSDLSAVLGKYGAVKRIVRERFPADIDLDMFSGVRGLYIDIQKEIPETLHFRGRKGRIYFDGVRAKCYVCKSELHLKKACPIYKARQQAEKQQTEQQQPEQKSPPAAKSSMDGTGEATAPVAPTITRKQHSNSKIAETKRQLSIESQDSNQPQQKKKTSSQPVPLVHENESDGSMITVPDESDSESELEDIDFMNASSETQQAWMKKRERKSKRLDKKIELYLSKQSK